MIWHWVLAVFVCYRVTALIVYDEGPFDVFLKIRIAGGRYDYAKNGRPATEIGRLLICPFCVGVWVAAVLAVALRPTGVLEWGMYWLSIAGAQAFLQDVVGYEDK